MKKIIFLQSKFPNDETAFAQVIARWNEYGQLLNQRNGEAALWVFTPRLLHESLNKYFRSSSVRQFPNVESHSSLLRRLLALNRDIRSETESVMLVCGDNQQSLLIGLLLKFRFKRFVKVQIQFHGDIYSWGSNPGIQGAVRVLLSRIGIAFADSIRIVSKFQSEEIANISHGAKLKYVLAPIPIDFSRVAQSVSIFKYDLAFIGRLHPERGVEEFLEIAHLLKNTKPEIRVVIVGDGPLRQQVDKELSKWLSDSTVTIAGYLAADEISKIYASSRVLVSCAPREGYGLTLREAVLSNILVVARESKGALEAKETFPEDIYLYRDTQQGVRFIFNALDQPRSEHHSKILQAQSERDTASLNRLIDSWLQN